MGTIGTWTFGVIDYVGPFLRNADPVGTVDPATLTSVDVLDDYSAINLSTLDAYVNGIQAFSGPSTFIAPFNGAGSSITPTTVDGYDGYHLVLDNTGLYPQSSTQVVAIVVSDNYGNTLNGLVDPAGDYEFEIYTGIASITVDPYEVTVDIKFGRPMTIDSALTSPTSYQFDKGMYCRLVDIVDSDNVRLWVELFQEQSSFTLTLSDSIRDADGYGIPASFRTATLSPFYSTATMSNYNGRVRSWHESRLVTSDSQRIYLSGTRGIDVFRRVNVSTPARWAQILDAYGINAMFVANFPNDLVITDTDPPYLTGQSPLPGGTASPSDSIAFTVADLITSVEPTSVTVYVDGIVVFAGGFGGWQSGYSGTAAVGYQQVSFVIEPPSPLVLGSTVSVRVVASDLLGNELNTMYTFSVSASLAFGFMPFGFGGFGGV